MEILAADIGGTKIHYGVLNADGQILFQQEEATIPDPATSLKSHFSAILKDDRFHIGSIGVCVPGIVWKETGKVWAPNIPGWSDFPLQHFIQKIAGALPVQIESDRTCYILGEQWQGRARHCTDAIYVAVGTGIGAGILCNNKVLQGAQDISGAIGWMRLPSPVPIRAKKPSCAFEEYASGKGMVQLSRALMAEWPEYGGMLKEAGGALSAEMIVEHYEHDPVARQTIDGCIALWGTAAANLISIFNPQKIIFGGGVFGAATRFVPEISRFAKANAQPLAAERCEITYTDLGRNAGLLGAACAAVQTIEKIAGNDH